jgi:hypothetical protein
MSVSSACLSFARPTATRTSAALSSTPTRRLGHGSPLRWSHANHQATFLGLTRTARYCVALTLFLELSNAVLAVPTISLYGRVICENYYQSRQGLVVPWDGAGDPCKLLPIQSEVALVRG